MNYTLGMIGAGHMAEAIARGAIDAGVLSADQLIASDVSAERRDVFQRMGIAVAQSNADVIKQSGQVLLTVKPQTLPDIAGELGGHVRDDQVVISIMAGIGSAKLSSAIGRPARIVRVMPNTPLMVGLGAAGIALGGDAKPGDEALALKLFGSGDHHAVMVDEKLIDAVTAVSGSGPAYVFYLAEAMLEAAEHLGLGDDAEKLVTQTILGAATLLRESGESAGELRRKVTSPGGTTEAAIKHMDGNKTIEVIVNAIKSAERRSRELGA